MKNRREFIKVAATALGGYILIPQFLTAIPLGANEKDNQSEDIHEILVVIQLSGGNDGLNSFIPYGNPLYYDIRKNLAIGKDEILKVNDMMGWHPSMYGINEIMQQSNLSVIQNVGYPNPDRSHFRSMEIWQTASESNEYLNSGWLGRYLDAACGKDEIIGGVNIDNIDSPALQGNSFHSISLQNPESFERQIKGMDLTENQKDRNDNLAFVRKLSISAFEGSDQIKKAIEKTKNYKLDYPDHQLGKNLNWISRMIKGGLNTKIYYTSFGGFDTHANQMGTHKNKLLQLSQGLKAFHDDLKSSNILSNITTLVFSEFGRRVSPNNSNGTDHGKAAPVFIMGGKNRGKIIGDNPDLANLYGGDLNYKVDFRSIYATILKDKFKMHPSFGGLSKFETLNIFN
jgi:uncharacterized protein (DUF1501 family)